MKTDWYRVRTWIYLTFLIMATAVILGWSMWTVTVDR